MKILKYLLNYISLFMIVLIVFALVYFRAEIFPNNINKPIDSSIALIESKFDIDIPQYQKSDNDVNYSVAADVSEDAPDVEVDVVSESEVIIEEHEKSLDQDIAMIEPVDVEIPAKENVSDQDVNDSAVNISEAIEVAKHDDVVVSKVDENTKTEVVDDPNNILNKARQAYWDGQINTAEEYYVQLSHNNPTANVYGELGNIYYMQGKWKEAGSAYYEAAIRLIDQKQYAQVNYLLRVIQGLNPDVARKLQKKMFG